MVHAKRWWMAGAIAVVLVSSAARAGEPDARTVAITVDGSGVLPGSVAAKDGEQVRLVFTRTAGPAVAALVLQDHGILAPLPLREPVTVVVRSAEGGIGYTVQPLAALGGTATTDEQEIAAGNTRGRG
jgi:plastocyanin domain-containing protein